VLDSPRPSAAIDGNDNGRVEVRVGLLICSPVLFPALHEIVTANEYSELGEDFERKEHELFGDSGFENMVDRVAAIEKNLGIYDLRQFTPKE